MTFITFSQIGRAALRRGKLIQIKDCGKMSTFLIDVLESNGRISYVGGALVIYANTQATNNTDVHLWSCSRNAEGWVFLFELFFCTVHTLISRITLESSLMLLCDMIVCILYGWVNKWILCCVYHIFCLFCFFFSFSSFWKEKKVTEIKSKYLLVYKLKAIKTYSATLWHAILKNRMWQKKRNKNSKLINQFNFNRILFW